MRYDDLEYVTDWVEHGRFPKIHDTIFNAAVEHLPDDPLLDLCASTGLLGRRLHDVLNLPACSQDGDDRAVAMGTEHGVYADDVPVKLLKLTPDSMPELADWMQAHEVATVVARRCLCVLSEAVPFEQTRDLFGDLGIKAVLLEGQTQTSRATHPFGHADRQVEALAPVFKLKWSSKHVRFLVRA